MEQRVKAIYHAGQLQLLESVQLKEGQQVTVTISPEETNHDPDTEATLAVLRSWLEEEEYPGEQQETLEYLMRVLDEDRLSDRKLFP